MFKTKTEKRDKAIIRKRLSESSGRRLFVYICAEEKAEKRYIYSALSSRGA